MKKLFTLVALLAMVLGANAKWSEEPIYKIDYSTYQGFPFYVMGYVPEFDNGHMTDFGASYKYAEVKEDAEETSDVIVKTQGGVEYYRWTEGGGWHQYFIADGITTKIDGRYKVIAKVKASEAVSININMGWGWGAGQSVGTSVAIPGEADFQVVEWEYTGIGGQSCNLVAQPGGSTATIEWLSLEVYEWQKDGSRPQEWIENVTNGDAEEAWPAWALTETDGINATWRGDRSGEICAYALTMGRNLDDQETLTTDSKRSRPFPADIEVEEGNESNHVFAAHVTQVDVIDTDASMTWSNQFWLQSTKEWEAGTTIKLHFRYKARTPITVSTQSHTIHPSIYKGGGIGDLNFTDEWQEYNKEWPITEGAANLTFNLSQNMKKGDTNDFYFDDFSWKYLKLDNGYFVSGINAQTATSYDDLDNAVQFEEGIDFEDNECLIATFGTQGDAKTYVDQLMISTKRGDDSAFKGATLKLDHNPKTTTPDEWIEYAPSTTAKIDLPGLGVWKVYLDTEYSSLAFEMLEGTAYELPDPVEVVTNSTSVAVNGDERDWLPADKEGKPVEAEVGNGAAWDNQFFIVANRALKKDEVTVLKFKYKADKGTEESPVKTTTQCHGAPGAYMHYGCIGDVKFTTEWQTFEQDFKVPGEADGMKSIAFNMAEIKDACVYEITDVQWYLKDASLAEGQTYENLIDATGVTNFYVKEGAGTTPSLFGTPQHAITIAETQNGTVTALKKQYEGAGVTITATPAEGYEVDAVVVKAGETAIEVTAGANNSFNFEMPKADVTITVTFKESTTGISNIAADKANSTVIYNLAGQRVANGFKGIVIKDGKKFVK